MKWIIGGLKLLGFSLLIGLGAATVLFSLAVGIMGGF